MLETPRVVWEIDGGNTDITDVTRLSRLACHRPATQPGFPILEPLFVFLIFLFSACAISI